MRKIAVIGILVAGVAVVACAADKKKPAEAAETGITREQGDAILEELRQIRQLLESGAGPAAAAPEAGGKVRVKIGNSPLLGDKNAPLTMVEFTDYQCGFCQRFHTATFPEIRKKYIDTGKIRFVSRDLPLDFHSNAMRAAQAARCAGDQGQFWTMRDRLVANPGQLAPADLQGYAQDLKLDVAAFQSCLDSAKYAAAVKADRSLAASLRIDGTPAFVVGKSTAEGVEGVVVMGALPLEAFEAKLQEAAE
jgi:protein-disulfide isomerase